MSRNSSPRGAHGAHRGCKCANIFSGFTLCLLAKKFVWRIGGLGPTICGLCLFELWSYLQGKHWPIAKERDMIHRRRRLRRVATDCATATSTYYYATPNQTKQGYHHNGDQTARRPHIFCSISCRDLSNWWKLHWDCWWHQFTVIRCVSVCFKMRSIDLYWGVFY